MTRAAGVAGASIVRGPRVPGGSRGRRRTDGARRRALRSGARRVGIAALWTAVVAGGGAVAADGDPPGPTAVEPLERASFGADLEVAGVHRIAGGPGPGTVAAPVSVAWTLRRTRAFDGEGGSSAVVLAARRLRVAVGGGAEDRSAEGGVLVFADGGGTPQSVQLFEPTAATATARAAAAGPLGLAVYPGVIDLTAALARLARAAQAEGAPRRRRVRLEQGWLPVGACRGLEADLAADAAGAVATVTAGTWVPSEREASAPEELAVTGTVELVPSTRGGGARFRWVVGAGTPYEGTCEGVLDVRAPTSPADPSGDAVDPDGAPVHPAVVIALRADAAVIGVAAALERPTRATWTAPVPVTRGAAALVGVRPDGSVAPWTAVTGRHPSGALVHGSVATTGPERAAVPSSSDGRAAADAGVGPLRRMGAPDDEPPLDLDLAVDVDGVGRTLGVGRRPRGARAGDGVVGAGRVVVGVLWAPRAAADGPTSERGWSVLPDPFRAGRADAVPVAAFAEATWGADGELGGVEALAAEVPDAAFDTIGAHVDGLARCAEAYPRSAVARLMYGAALAATGDVGAARACDRFVVATAPWLRLDALALVAALRSGPPAVQGLGPAQTAWCSVSSDPEATALVADAAVTEGKLVTAWRVLEEAPTAPASLRMARRRLLGAIAAAGSRLDVVPLWRALAEGDPTDPDAEAGWAAALEQAGSLDALLEVLEAPGRAPSALLGPVARCAAATAEPARARGWIARWRDAGGRPAAVGIATGRLVRRTGDVADAVATWARAAAEPAVTADDLDEVAALLVEAQASAALEPVLVRLEALDPPRAARRREAARAAGAPAPSR